MDLKLKLVEIVLNLLYYLRNINLNERDWSFKLEIIDIMQT